MCLGLQYETERLLCSSQSTASSDTPSDLEFRDLRDVDRFLASKGIAASPGYGASASVSSVGTQDLEDALDISGRLRRVADVLSSTAQVSGVGLRAME